VVQWWSIRRRNWDLVMKVYDYDMNMNDYSGDMSACCTVGSNARYSWAGNGWPHCGTTTRLAPANLQLPLRRTAAGHESDYRKHRLCNYNLTPR